MKSQTEPIILMTVLIHMIGHCNGQVPVVSDLPSFITKDENFENGTELFSFDVTVADSTEDIIIHTSGLDTSSLVFVNQTSGNNIKARVITKSELDRDGDGRGLPGRESVDLKFIATDNRGNQVNIQTTLYISDINDNDPILPYRSYTWEISERPNENETTFSKISATDYDSGNNGKLGFRYKMEPVSQSDSTADIYRNTFDMDAVTGTVRLKLGETTLDYETNNYYQFNITVTDQNGNGKTGHPGDLIIRVLDVQDSPPFFTGIPYRKTINETIPSNSSVIAVTAQDGDSGVPNKVNYTILNGKCSTLFEINAVDGEIRTADVIDRDTGDINDESGVCTLTVKAQEIDNDPSLQHGSTTATTRVTITIEDIDDNPPTFNSQTYNAEVQENTPNNVPITLLSSADIIVTDADQGVNANIELSLFYPNGTACEDFKIEPSTIPKSGSALIRVNNSKILDYETIHNITLLIVANDGLYANNTATVSLTIIDINDNNPQFDNSSYEFRVEENTPTNVSVAIITATDKDSDSYGKIRYSISGGNERFIVDSDSGNITTNCADCSAELDREKVDIFYMTYTATDGGGRSNSTSLVIKVTDANDNKPEFTRTDYSAYITENDGKYNVTPVIQLEARDLDEPGTNNSAVEYEIIHRSESNMNSNISINGTSGEIFLNSPVDYEILDNKAGIITIIVKAKDLGIPVQSSNTTVIIHVQDENDNSPIFNVSHFDTNITENATSHVGELTHVGSVLATDSDGTAPNNQMQYFIQSGAMDHFAINPRTGEIYVQINAKLDRENIPKYNITIIAIDQGSPPRNGSASVLIDILDVNDELPIFNSSNYVTRVFENATIESTVIVCPANDNDTDHNLRYSINIEQATNESGMIINSSLVKDFFDVNDTDGTVYVKSTLDRETAKVIVFTIKVEDLNAYSPSPQTATASLTITLLDVNDNCPEFVGAPYSVNVSENAQNPTILLTISATDKDEDKIITYKIINTSESSSFEIDPTTGVFSKVGPLDREMVSNMTLNISATDNGSPHLIAFTSIEVTVLDFNDNTPEILNLPTVINIPENKSNGSNIFNVNATDDDIGPNANLTFHLDDDFSGSFSINEGNGSVFVTRALDRETTPSFVLRIRVQDNPLNDKEQKSSTKTLSIQLEDVNDNAPIFEYEYYSKSIVENTEVDLLVLSVSASDADKENTNNSKIKYSFNNDTSPSGLFRIDMTAGSITVNKSLVGHVDSYILGLTATDYGEPMKSNTSVINITVLDVNLNNPTITDVPHNNTIKVYECVDIGYEIYEFNYTDGDYGINAKADFNISEIDDVITDTLEITPDGILKTKRKLNALQKDSYRFQIQVTDRGTPNLSSQKIIITVKVVDVNDNLPSFNEDKIPFSVSENRPVGQVVGTVTAHDPDQDSVACYEIKDTKMAKVFAIGEKNGSIVTKIDLDYENTCSYKFEVHVRDCTIVDDISVCGNITHNTPEKFRNKTEITVNVLDANDNPPVFKLEEITVGMRRVTEVNTTLDLSLKTKDYIEDKDTVTNGRLAWTFKNAGDIQVSSSLSGTVSPLSGVMNCAGGDRKKHIICVSGNGTLINNKYYSEDVSGYLVVPVNVSDAAGSDTVNVKIFLIGNSQILVMTVLGEKETIAETKNEILKIYSDVTGYEFVYDWLEDHKTPDGRVENFKTDIYFHVVDKQTDRVLSANEAIKIVDGDYEKLLEAMKQYKVLQVVSSVKVGVEEENSVKTVYILAAIVAALALTVAIVIYVSLTTRNTYKRKLKAATVKPQDIRDVSEKNSTVVPGSNMYSRQANPLLHAEIPEKIEYDNMSMGSHNSLDSNSVGIPKIEGDYDQVEEKEVRMDMFTEDVDYTRIPENPLEAALKQYDMQNMQNKQDIDSTDGIVSPNDMGTLQFENQAYIGELESTEI